MPPERLRAGDTPAHSSPSAPASPPHRLPAPAPPAPPAPAHPPKTSDAPPDTPHAPQTPRPTPLHTGAQRILRRQHVRHRNLFESHPRPDIHPIAVDHHFQRSRVNGCACAADGVSVSAATTTQIAPNRCPCSFMQQRALQRGSQSIAYPPADQTPQSNALPPSPPARPTSARSPPLPLQHTHLPPAPARP